MPSSKTNRLPEEAASVQPGGFRWVAAWNSFWFASTDPIGLHGVRVLTGLILLYWLVSFAGHQTAFFGLGGWVDQQALREMSRLEVEQLPQPLDASWSLLYLAPGQTGVTIAYFAAIAVVTLFTLGIATRLTGILTWLVVASFTANPALPYGGDALLLMLSFYLMIGYLLLDLGADAEGKLSLGTLLLGSRRSHLFGKRSRSDRAPSVAANVALRLLQVHLAILVFIAGIHKLQFGIWWSGLSLWFPLHQPFEITLAEILERYSDPDLVMVPLSLLCYGLLAWQISFPFLMWRESWRRVMLFGAALGWLGSIFLFQLPIFGPAIFAGCLSFVPPETWRRWAGAIVRVTGRNPDVVSAASVPETSETHAKMAAG